MDQLSHIIRQNHVDMILVQVVVPAHSPEPNNRFLFVLKNNFLEVLDHEENNKFQVVEHHTLLEVSQRIGRAH